MLDSSLVILDGSGLDFSSMHQVLQQNSIPRARGSLDLADSSARILQILYHPWIMYRIVPVTGCENF
jgi:hypothetical protein